MSIQAVIEGGLPCAEQPSVHGVERAGTKDVEQPRMDEGLGQRLRRLRKARGMTLDNLADASGISKSMLSKLETDARGSLTLDRAAEICNALGISLDQLAGRRAPDANRKRNAAIAKARKLAEALQRALAEID